MLKILQSLLVLIDGHEFVMVFQHYLSRLLKEIDFLKNVIGALKWLVDYFKCLQSHFSFGVGICGVIIALVIGF